MKLGDLVQYNVINENENKRNSTGYGANWSVSYSFSDYKL